MKARRYLPIKRYFIHKFMPISNQQFCAQSMHRLKYLNSGFSSPTPSTQASSLISSPSSVLTSFNIYDDFIQIQYFGFSYIFIHLTIQKFKEAIYNIQQKMRKNKILPMEKKIDSVHALQSSGNTQQNFMSLHELSSVGEGEKNNTPTISNIRKKYILQSLINRLRYLVAPTLKPECVTENWSEERKTVEESDYQGTQRQTLLEEISYNHKFWQVIKTIQAVCSVILFWAISTELTFLPRFKEDLENNVISIYFKTPLCFFIIFSLVLKEILIIREKIKIKKSQCNQQSQTLKLIQQQQQQIDSEEIYKNLQDISRSLIEGIMCLLYMIIHAFGYSPIRLTLQIIILCVSFYKIWNFREIIEHIYNYVETKDLKKQFRLIALFAFLLCVSHLIALVLYLMTYIYPENNWMSNRPNMIAANQHQWFSHYMCCIYFAITTMATVGYGDFTPVQAYQMLLVSAIQLFGTALFGYMINVVGLTVTEINTKNQQFENHISTIHKLQNHYQISRQLCQKFKQDIIKNETIKKQTPLSQTEEIQFFKMIPNSLKQQFILETNIKVIKKSIFFLTHFTVNFQNEIALKLVRKIYKKNQKISLRESEGENEQRCMLIINSGSVDIDIQNQSSNTEMKKFIKNISPQEGKPTVNVFGYSALILNRDIDLSVTTKDTSVIYLLKRKDVLECMDKNMLDFEGIAELRETMLQFQNINSIQAPTLRDIQRHFVPNIFLVNKKKKVISQKRREDYKRTDRKTKMKLITARNYQFRTMVCIDLDEQLQKEVNQIDGTIKNNSLELNNNTIIQQDLENMETKQAMFVTKTEQFKNYQNFMKKSNIRTVLPRYHEYSRQVRRQRRLITTLQQNISKYIDKRAKSERMLSYSEGQSRRTSKKDLSQQIPQQIQ